MNKPRIAFVTSHPIQYQVPVFRALAERDDLDFKVFFAMIPSAQAQGKGFGVSFKWDIPLLEGYDYQILKNISQSPSVVAYKGCDTPAVGESLAEWGATSVIVNGWVVKTCLQTLRWCRSRKVPCFVRGEANHFRPRPWWKKFLQKRLVRRFSGVLPIGKANRQFYTSYGVSEKAMFASPYCIDNDRFQRAAETARLGRADIRNKWQIAPDATCFLFCAKFEQKKHPLELVKSFFNRPNHQATKQHLLMVGDGELKAACELLVKEWSDLGSNEKSSITNSVNVTFTGFLNQSEIIDAYAASDCLVLPSDHGETWGLVVNEAFSTGIPAIVSDQVGCHPDLIVPKETGFLFRYGNWDELSQLLQWCDQHRDQLKKMGFEAQKLIQNYSPKKAADGIVAAAQWVSHE